MENNPTFNKMDEVTTNARLKKPFSQILGLLLGIALYSMPSISAAQSAVYVFKDIATGKSDYMFVYGMTSIEEAEQWAEERFEELKYDKSLIKKHASTDEKGYGMIIRSVYKSDTGLLMTVYGAALGAMSYEEAEKKAMENLREFNPDWPENSNYRIIQKFYDEPEAY